MVNILTTAITAFVVCSLFLAMTRTPPEPISVTCDCANLAARLMEVEAKLHFLEQAGVVK